MAWQWKPGIDSRCGGFGPCSGRYVYLFIYLFIYLFLLFLFIYLFAFPARKLANENTVHLAVTSELLIMLISLICSRHRPVHLFIFATIVLLYIWYYSAGAWSCLFGLGECLPENAIFRGKQWRGVNRGMQIRRSVPFFAKSLDPPGNVNAIGNFAKNSTEGNMLDDCNTVQFQ